MGTGYQPIKVPQTSVILCQNNGMIGALLLIGFVSGLLIRSIPVDVLQCFGSPFLQLVQHHPKDLNGGVHIIQGPVGGLHPDSQLLCDPSQFIGFKIRKQGFCQGQGVHIGKVKFVSQSFGIMLQESDIELRIVGNQHTALNEIQHLWKDLSDGFRVPDHVIVDMGELHNPFRYWLFRVDKTVEFSHRFAVLYLHDPNFRDPLRDRGKARRLQIQDAIGRIQALPLRMRHGRFSVRYQIGFHTIQDLHILVVPPQKLMGFRKRLHNPMIRNGNRLHAPAHCPPDQIRCTGHGIHLAHLRM